jgi:hypothetical protein
MFILQVLNFVIYLVYKLLNQNEFKISLNDTATCWPFHILSFETKEVFENHEENKWLIIVDFIFLLVVSGPHPSLLRAQTWA